MDIKTRHQVTTSPGHQLRNKKVLITAGPTWVPIDDVRVISNIATGKTGVLLAEKLCRQGAKVTLLLGHGKACCLNKRIKVIPFLFLDELKRRIKAELRNKKYDIALHSAAVSDYKMAGRRGKKIKSGKNPLRLTLVPTEKLIKLFKAINPDLFLVGFKFEPGVSRQSLLDRTKGLIIGAGLDLAVANTVTNGRYQALILKKNKIYGPFVKKEAMVNKLCTLISGSFKH